MKKFRCTNPNCKNPLLFEGNFIGIVKKKCPKCKEVLEFEQLGRNNLDKIC